MLKKAVWVFLLAVFATGQIFSQELYRYLDKDGITILNSSIPAEYVNVGYEILNSQGQVIQVVLPAGKVEEKAELVVEKSDTILMSSYSDVTEIEEHRDRKIQSLAREIDNIKTDQRVLGMQLEKEIAERDRISPPESAKEIPQHLRDQLVELESRIGHMTTTAKQLDAQLASRNEDADAIRRDYAVKIERFLQIEQNNIDVRHTSIDGME